MWGDRKVGERTVEGKIAEDKIRGRDRRIKRERRGMINITDPAQGKNMGEDDSCSQTN